MIGSLVYRSMPSPIGDLFLGATPTGVCQIAWETSEAAFVGEIEARWRGSARPNETGAGGDFRTPDDLLGAAACQLDEYFAGRRQSFDLPLDLSSLGLFQRQVLTTLIEVPFGEVVSYGELAERAGYRGAARAVGGVMRANPLPIVIPCHRVLKSDGGLGGFGGRPHLKQFLLQLEGRPALALEY